MKVPLCSKVATDQEAGSFATKSPHHTSLLLLQKWHFSKFLRLQKILPIAEFNKRHSQLVTALN